MTRINYTILSFSCKWYWITLGVLAILVLNGLYYAHYMEHQGHWVTGMNNQVVWGLPHVFAIFLILSASGVLNIASLYSVFGKPEYQAWSRLSGLLAATLLLGGLGILVLDLGRPDRLIIALTHYNFRSIFAWNVFLYIGFVVVVCIYLWMAFEPKMNKYIVRAGFLAFAWRLVLTTGTGSIFAVLIARSSYDSWFMIPLFIFMSLSFGTAVFILYVSTLLAVNRQSQQFNVLQKLGKLMAIFILFVVAVTVIIHLSGMADQDFQDYQRFILWRGGQYTVLFWLGQIAIGTVFPVILLLRRNTYSLSRLVVASSSVLVGAFCQLYVIIIGGQAWPLELFPGRQISSGFFDGVIANYSPSIPELSLGVGGVCFSIFNEFIHASNFSVHSKNG